MSSNDQGLFLFSLDNVNSVVIAGELELLVTCSKTGTEMLDLSVFNGKLA